MKQLLLWLIVAAVLVAGVLLYRSRSGSDLNVTPDAAQEIEKREAALICAGGYVSPARCSIPPNE